MARKTPAQWSAMADGVAEARIAVAPRIRGLRLGIEINDDLLALQQKFRRKADAATREVPARRKRGG